MMIFKIVILSSFLALLNTVNVFAEGTASSRDAYKVTNVKKAEVLNIRKSPSMRSPIILQLPSDARWIIKRALQTKGKWQKVAWGVKEGWVYNQYLGTDVEASQFLVKHRQCVRQNPDNSICCGFKSTSSSRNLSPIKTYMVVKVARGQSLNVRASGRASAKKIATIPHDGMGIVKFPGKTAKRGRTTWQKIRWNGRDGWVNDSFLKYDPIISDYRNIVQEICSSNG